MTKKSSRPPHEVLGLEKGASGEEIAKACRRLALKYHTDGEEPDPVKYQEILDAREALEGKAAGFDWSFGTSIFDNIKDFIKNEENSRAKQGQEAQAPTPPPAQEAAQEQGQGQPGLADGVKETISGLIDEAAPRIAETLNEETLKKAAEKAAGRVDGLLKAAGVKGGLSGTGVDKKLSGLFAGLGRAIEDKIGPKGGDSSTKKGPKGPSPE